MLLERGAQKIACEISVTTSPEHEVGNVKKCLEAGVDQVVVVSPSPSGLKRIEEAVKADLSAEALERVVFLAPPAFMS